MIRHATPARRSRVLTCAAALMALAAAYAAPSAQSSAKKALGRNANTPPPGIKRLTYMEQREWEQIEGKIMEAEEALQNRQRALDDPAAAKDHLKLAQCCRDFEAAQEDVRRLYARWEELEAKQK